MKILFVNRKTENCGVIDYGIRLYNVLKKSINYEIDFIEVSDSNDIKSSYEMMRPDLIIYNYYHSVLPFVTNELFRQLNLSKHIIIYHESSFDLNPNAIMVVDSTFIDDEKNNIFSTPRPLFEDFELVDHKNLVPTIGSFGFGFPDKNFPKIAEMVCDQFEFAKIRFNIPFATFGDIYGSMARHEIEKTKNVIAQKNKNIEFEFSHNFLTQKDTLEFLSKNDVNIFLYDKHESRSLSSTIDYSLSVRKPIGISDSHMFRHISWVRPSIILPQTTIPEIIKNGIEPLKPIYEKYSNQNLINKFEYIIKKML